MGMLDRSQEIRANGLYAARVERDGRMLRDVEFAIAGILQDNQTLSFYRVAERACVARSTLYRKPELRSLVEQARECQSDIAKQAGAPQVGLVEENELLRREIERLTHRLQVLSSGNAQATQAICGGIIEYAVIGSVVAA